MRSFVRSSCTSSLIIALTSCGGDDTTGTSKDAGASVLNSGGSNGTAGSTSPGGSIGSGGAASGSGGTTIGSGGTAGGSGGAAGSGGSGASDAGRDAGPIDPCSTALFCEKFDGYAGVAAITDKQKFGPWHAALQTGATMNLDGMNKVSGSNALHVHIDNTVTAGGRLYADGNQPIFASKPTHVYGRMMMYIDPNGTSIHWTFFGVNGDAEPSSPAVGRNAQYIMSSLPKNGVNTYSFVYGLQAMGTDGYHDCSSQSSTSMPSAWACISFEMDSVARKLRMYKDGAVDPILSVDDHGKGCVNPTPVAAPWYGPSISQLFVGAWSFHPMNAPLDVWIDDLVVDTKPVTCPPP
jgi:hypothetical protein